jgi:uncharacterized protein
MYSGPIIDIDIHHTWRSDAELLEYLPARWRQHIAADGQTPSLRPPTAMNMSQGPNGTNKRFESFPPAGGPPGSDLEWMREQLLDPYRIAHGVLCYDIGWQSGFGNPYLAVALCRAVNNWSIDHWLDGRDERLHGAILVPSEMPVEAAKEIRRLAGHPRMVEVLLIANMLGKPFGHPAYHPIYEAASECGLPVALHLGGDVFPTGSTRTASGGTPMSRLELFATYEQGGMHHTSSMFVHGIFEKFPTLKVILKEYGFAWLTWLLWRLDGQIGLLRRENPLVDRLPSELFRERMLVSTQPFDHTPDRRQMIELLEAFGGMEDVLVFASDYPHWDTDEPNRVATRLPEHWLQKVFHDNAARFFGFPLISDGHALATA